METRQVGDKQDHACHGDAVWKKCCPRRRPAWAYDSSPWVGCQHTEQRGNHRGMQDFLRRRDNYQHNPPCLGNVPDPEWQEKIREEVARECHEEEQGEVPSINTLGKLKLVRIPNYPSVYIYNYICTSYFSTLL